MKTQRRRSRDRNQLSLFPEMIEQMELEMEAPKNESQPKNTETPGEDRESGVLLIAVLRQRKAKNSVATIVIIYPVHLAKRGVFTLRQKSL